MRQGSYGFAALAAVPVGNEDEDHDEDEAKDQGQNAGGEKEVRITPITFPVRAVRPAAAKTNKAQPRPPQPKEPRQCSTLWETCLLFVHPAERANVGTHGLGFLCFATYLVIRIALAANAAAPLAIDPFTLVQIGAIAVTTAVFGASAAYHASSKSVVASAYLLALDRSFVYAAIVASSTADLVVATMGAATPLTACALATPLLPDPSVPWQTYLDPLLAGAIAIVCVASVRFTRWPTDTSGQNGFDHPSGIDSRRPGHISGAFGLTYAVIAGACTLGWVCSADYELRMFPEGVGAAVVAVKAVSTAVAILLGTNDMRETTDAYAMHFPVALRKHLPRSHTLWHAAAVLTAACSVGVREWALAAQIEASTACAYRLVDVR